MRAWKNERLGADRVRTPMLACAGACVVGCTFAMGGCQQQVRRITITSEPSGALVRLNDTQVGRTPVEVDFTYFGVYDVVLTKRGYEPLFTQAEAEPRLHDQPVIDFFALAVPGGTETLIDWHFVLDAEDRSVEGMLSRAADTREALRSEDTSQSAPVNADSPD